MVLGQSLIVILTALTVSICSDPDVDPQILYTTEAFYTPLLLNRTGWSFGGVPVTQLEVMPSLSGHADLLNWMFYFRRPNSPIGFIYGTPPLNDDGDIDIDLVILNRVTFNTTSYRLKYRILNRDEIYKFQVEMKFFDMDIEDFFNGGMLTTVQDIFANRLWQSGDHNANSVYVTQVARPIHVGGRFPLDPSEKECVVIRVGCNHNFTQQLYRLESEVRQIKNRDPCPKHYKATTVDVKLYFIIMATSDNNKGDYEDISDQLYPDRKRKSASPSEKQSSFWYDLLTGNKNTAENFVRIRCRYKVEKALNESPLVKLLVSALRSKGCEIDMNRHICCENCGEQVTGGYDTTRNQIVVCHNRVYTKEMTAAVIGHELIHMFDYCRAKLDFNNLDHIACSEIRAANLVHCSMTSSFFSGTTGFNKIGASHRECVKAKALSSILAVRKGMPIEQAAQVVDRVFDRCYNDLEPIGRRIRLNSRHIKWAYRERFLYDYDSFT
ncbi:mitochondrial inner membrane protease atp23 [Dermatophagoides farinae]|uniref:Mitochondrial inner membrane protease ATP23 homolog n=2 Tax=Dermatophagoides farinae TaxID=6954 RepID=A0A9D4P4Y1_DERFA|nr:mitochondrial inner membrane protease atp23 [Dermatophagoides farinae]